MQVGCCKSQSVWTSLIFQFKISVRLLLKRSTWWFGGVMGVFSIPNSCRPPQYAWFRLLPWSLWSLTGYTETTINSLISFSATLWLLAWNRTTFREAITNFQRELLPLWSFWQGSNEYRQQLVHGPTTYCFRGAKGTGHTWQPSTSFLQWWNKLRPIVMGPKNTQSPLYTTMTYDEGNLSDTVGKRTSWWMIWSFMQLSHRRQRTSSLKNIYSSYNLVPLFQNIKVIHSLTMVFHRWTSSIQLWPKDQGPLPISWFKVVAQRSHTDANSSKSAPCKHWCQVSQNEHQYDRQGHILSIPNFGLFSMGIEECPLVSLTWSILDFKIKLKEKFNATCQLLFWTLDLRDRPQESVICSYK